MKSFAVNNKTFALITFISFSLAPIQKASAEESSDKGTREGLDYSAHIGIRSLPIGGAAAGTVGFGKLLWGDNAGEGSFMYGYIRPAIKLQSSGVVNVADLRLDVAPIAPLVFSFGHNDSFRAANFSGIDCITNACKNRLSRNYLRVKALYGYQQFFAAGLLRFDWLRSSTEGKPFYDEATSILAAPTRDRSRSLDAILGYKIAPQHTAGLWYAQSAMRDSKQSNDTYLAFYRYERNEFEYSAGAGCYRSDLQTRSFTAFAGVSWTGLSSIGLN